jgi:hypothetical protein
MTRIIKEFFSDSTGDFSMTRFWTSVCFATCTWAIIHKVDTLDWTMLLVYAGIVGGVDIAKKWILK